MSNFTIRFLSREDGEAVLSAVSYPLRQLRLKSLQTDPANFRSKYSNEVNQPQEFWINRLSTKNVGHWLAYDIDNKNNLSPHENDVGGKMIAFLVIRSFGKQITDAVQTDSSMDASNTYEHYELGALYVDPEYRGHGLSTNLISAGIRQMTSQKQNQEQRVVLTLGVRKFNAPAIGVYQKFGFERYGEDIQTEDDGEEDAVELMRLELVPGGGTQ